MTMHTQITTDPMPWLARYTTEQSRALEDYHLGQRGAAPKSWEAMRREETGVTSPSPKARPKLHPSPTPKSDGKWDNRASRRPEVRDAIMDVIRARPSALAEIAEACPHLSRGQIANQLVRAYANGEIDRAGRQPMVYFIAGDPVPDVTDGRKSARNLPHKWLTTVQIAEMLHMRRDSAYRHLTAAQNDGIVEYKIINCGTAMGRRAMWRRIEA